MRITLTEIERKKLIDKEKKERRIARLIQVRAQSRVAAQCVLREVRLQKEEKVEELSSRIESETRRILVKTSQHPPRLHDNQLQFHSHQKENRPRRSIDHTKQVERGMEALNRLKEEKKAKNIEKLKAMRRIEKAKKEATRICQSKR